MAQRLRAGVDRGMTDAYQVDSALEAEATLLVLARELDKTPGGSEPARGAGRALIVRRLDLPPTPARR